jgi:hypothetical protein
MLPSLAGSVLLLLLGGTSGFLLGVVVANGERLSYDRTKQEELSAT